MRKIMVCLVSFFICIGSVYSVDEYPIDETVKIYDSNLKALQSRITYYPSAFYSYKNAIFLYFTDYFNCAFIFGKGDEYDKRAQFIGILDKCIEWTAVAKENNVHKLSRTVAEEVEILYMYPGVSNYPDVFLVNFIFSIQEINNKEEIMLIINYKTVDQVNNGSRGSYIVIKQNDFIRLKQIFSDNYLAQFDKEAKEQAKTEELFQ